jgi:TetR/AcrR family acrAB operon transcriptional repressor
MARRTKEEAVGTRNALIDAAEQVFHEKGVSRASLGDIAQAAGATRGAIYWHFKDKGDLFDAMMDRVRLPFEEGFSQFERSTCTDPVQCLRAVLALVFRGVASDARARHVFEIALFKVEYVGELVSVRDRHLAAAEAFTLQLARLVELAEQDQQVELFMTPVNAATALHAMLDGLIRNWILGQANFDLEALGRVGSDAFLRGLGLRMPAGSVQIDGGADA